MNPIEQACKISFEHFKRHVRYLHLLHGKVLNAGTKVLIPLPSSSGRMYCTEAIEGLSSASGSFGSSAGSSEVDAAQQAERKTLREMLARLQEQICVLPDNVEESQRVYAFDPEEVRAILEAAISPIERLVIVVFFVTGLRIGGVCRLQVPESIQTTSNIAISTVPEVFSTIEKNGKVRKIRFNDTCRVLVTRWYARGRPMGRSRYLFPGKSGEVAMSTRSMWQLCHRVFDRANVSGKHVHPHTFRHTVIHMLYMKGMSFDAIAKWIGHSNPSVTSGIYGRLSQDNINGLMRGVPFVDEGSGADIKERWQELSEYIAHPYVFESHENIGLKRRAFADGLQKEDFVGRRAIQKAAREAGFTGKSGLVNDLQEMVQKMVDKEMKKVKI